MCEGIVALGGFKGFLGHQSYLMGPHGVSDREMSEVNGTVSCSVSVFIGLGQYKIGSCRLLKNYPRQWVEMTGAGDGEAGHLHGTMVVGHKEARLKRNPLLVRGTGIR